MPLLQFVSSEPFRKSSFAFSIDGIDEYFYRCIHSQPAEQVLQMLIALAQGKQDYLDAETAATLEQLTELSFHQVLNHWCQILISHWYQERSNSLLIAELFDRLDAFSSIEQGLSLQEKWTRNFVNSATYRKLKRINYLIAKNSGSEQITTSEQNLRTLFYRYPFLYNHGLLNLDTHRSYRKMIKNAKAKRKEIFSIKLAKYATYRVRLLQIAKARQLTQSAGRFLRPIPNPTLLNDKQLNHTLFQLTWSLQAVSLPKIGTFTASDLINYLFSDLNDTSRKHRQLKRILSADLYPIVCQVSSSILNESSLLECSRRILNFLILDPASCFLPTLMTYLNPSEIINVLLKLIRLCPPLKSTLESKLFQLFDKYQSTPQTELNGFISLLETYLVASSLLNNTSLIRDISICISKEYNSCKI